MTANAEIVLEEHPNALIVPEAAVTYDAQKNAFVDVVAPGTQDRPPEGAGQGRRRQRHEDQKSSKASSRATRSFCLRSAASRVTTMREAVIQSLQNLRANKLRSFLTMFGILWGMISVVVLSATGEGFRRGNDKVLLELGKNIGIVWGGRTSLQAGGERAGRQIFLTLDDARALADRVVDGRGRQPRARSAARVEVKSSLQRGDGASQRHRAAVSGHPHHRARVRPPLHVARRSSRCRASRSSASTWPSSCSASATSWARAITLNGMPYTVVGKIRKKNQDSNYSGPDNNKIFVPFARDGAGHAAAETRSPARCRTSSWRRRTWVVDRAAARVLDERTGRIEDVDWPLEQNVRADSGAPPRLRPGRHSRRSRCGTPRCRR